MHSKNACYQYANKFYVQDLSFPPNMNAPQLMGLHDNALTPPRCPSLVPWCTTLFGSQVGSSFRTSTHLLLGMLAASAGKIRFFFPRVDFDLGGPFVCREGLLGQLTCLSLTFSTLSILTVIKVSCIEQEQTIVGPL